MAMGNMKWLLLATVFCVLAILIMLAGLYRNNKIANTPTDIPEEAEGYKLRGKRIFIKHTAIAAILILIAIIIRFTLGGTGA